MSRALAARSGSIWAVPRSPEEGYACAVHRATSRCCDCPASAPPRRRPVTRQRCASRPRRPSDTVTGHLDGPAFPHEQQSVCCGSEAISAPRRPIRKRGSSRPPCWRSGSVRARSPARIRIARGPSPERRLSGSGTVDGRPGGVAELVLSESQCVRRGLPLFERADVCWLEDGDGSGAPRRSRREGGRRPNSAASRPSKPWSGLAPTWPPHCTCSRASSTTRAGLVDQLGVGGRRNVISPDDIDRLPAARRLAEWRGLTTDTVESVTVAPADSREWDAGRIDVRFLGR